MQEIAVDRDKITAEREKVAADKEKGMQRVLVWVVIAFFCSLVLLFALAVAAAGCLPHLLASM